MTPRAITLASAPCYATAPRAPHFFRVYRDNWKTWEDFSGISAAARLFRAWRQGTTERVVLARVEDDGDGFHREAAIYYGGNNR